MSLPVFSTPTDAHYYFGYFDKSPISKDGSKLLAMKADFIDHLPDKTDRAVIGYFDLTLKDQVFHPLRETATFNWQQGCMLHWFGDRNTEIIYNDLKDGRFVSIVFNIETGEQTVLPMALYSLSSDSSFATCVDNERLHWCRRGYSYDGVSNEDKDLPVVPGDAIYHMDIATKQVSIIVDIETVMKVKPISIMKEGVHYLEHTMISPDDKRLAFIHRWKLESGGIYSRLFTVNMDGSDLYLLNDSGRMSHYCWQDNQTIFGWGGVANPINSLRKYKKFAKVVLKPLLPLYKKIVSGNADQGVSSISSLVTGDSYVFFSDKSTLKKRVPTSLLDRDGHPTFQPNSQTLLVTDTYPDVEGYQSLILYDHAKEDTRIIDKVATTESLNFSANRCDLHPKWSFDGRYISIDTMIDARRGINVYQT